MAPAIRVSVVATGGVARGGVHPAWRAAVAPARVAGDAAQATPAHDRRLQVSLVTDRPRENAPPVRATGMDDARLPGPQPDGATPRLGLAPDEIHLWCARHGDI